MSKFFKIGLAVVSSFFVTTSLYAQATIEEVIVTAQRTEQSLQDVPIAVSAFTDEALAERQIEYASDIQLQVPGVNFTATQFGAGGFSIRGITNLATAASADAGVEIHLNGLPLGLTSVSEIQYLDMERLEVLRGPQGTLFGRNATGGVINLISAKPDLDEFYGSADIKYGSDGEQMVTAMLNVPITDQLGFRFAYTNLQKDGIHENLYSKATNDFDNRDGYQWRATFLYEFDDTMRMTLVHNAYDEESARNQVSGVWCETGGSLTQGCVVGGNQVFEQISPMSNGSTLPSALGGNLAFFMPGGLGCTTDAAGAAAPNDGTCYNPLAGLAALATAAAAPGAPDAVVNAYGAYLALTDRPTIPNEFFKANVWRSPIHQAQESTSQLLFEKDFDQGQFTASVNVKNRVFYRDTASLSDQATTIRWSEDLQNNDALYLSAALDNQLGGLSASDTEALPQEGVPLGYSNHYISSANCDLDAGKTGIFGGADCIRGYHINPVSGDASFSDETSTTYEIKYASDLDGDFNFLVGAINISNQVDSFYDVYASGITMNGLQLPSSIADTYRDGYQSAVLCGLQTAETADCDQDLIDGGMAILGGIATLEGLTVDGTTALGADGNASSLTNPTQLDPEGVGFDAAQAGAALAAAMPYALDKIRRIDGLYTEHFHNETAPFNLDASAIFTEFYFNVADNHKLTLGLRYTEDKKKVRTRATFYDSALVSNWSTAADSVTDAAGNAQQASTFCAEGGAGAAVYDTVANDGSLSSEGDPGCLAIGATVGQAIGEAPGLGQPGNLLAAGGAATANPNNGSEYFLTGLDAFNADYANAEPAIIPQMNFTNTTGRLVWDWTIDDDTLMYVSYSKGFKGGGFNPPFNAAQFPNTPYAFDSTKVDALELGIKATVPEIGLVANASFYYNDFENFHLGSIRNETAINYGIPLESYGAELELLLNPPTVPGLSFNMSLSLYDSEIGDVSIVNPHDLGGHYNQTAESANWHVMKSATANSFLVKKDRMGYINASALQYKMYRDIAIAANTTTAVGVDGVAGTDDDVTTVDQDAVLTALATATAADGATLLSTTNEFFAVALGASAAAAAANAVDLDESGAVDAADGALAGHAARGEIEAALALLGDLEMSAAATAYGTKATVCHMLNISAAANINTCLPDAVSHLAGGGAGNLAGDHDPTATLIYSPVTLEVNGTEIANASGTLLPSISLLGTGDSLQTGGLCKLWDVFTGGTATAAALTAGVTSPYSEDDGATQGINTDAHGANATETCYGTAELNPGFISSGLEQSLKGNKMPFADVTLSLGLAYTFQTNNLEVTPRLDYYYRSDSNQSVFNIEQNKVPAWDEINFRLNIVPTNGDWRVIFYGQNLTDERNVTATAITNSSTSHTNTVFVREPRSFGFQFGLDF